MRNEVTIKVLRGVSPEWAWIAKRAGFGWEYLGTQGTKSVLVYAVAQNKWCVYAYEDGHERARAVTFTSWWLEVTR